MVSDDARNARERRMLNAGRCPDCGHRGFLLGPRGGAAQNIACGRCLHAWNVTMLPGGELAFLARIGNDWFVARYDQF